LAYRQRTGSSCFGGTDTVKLLKGQDDKACTERGNVCFLILLKELFNAQSELILSYYEECKDIYALRRIK